MGTGVKGTASYFLELGFANDGRACAIDSRSHLAMTATTDTHTVLRAKSSAPRFPIKHHERVTMVVGISSGLTRCYAGGVSSVGFHSRWGSQTVSFPGHPYFVCTPAHANFYPARFPA